MINDWNRITPLGVRYPLVSRAAGKLFNTTGMDWEKCYHAGIDLLCVAHFNFMDEWLSMPTDPSSEAPAHTFRMMDLLEKELESRIRPYASLARNYQELADLLAVPKDSPDYRIAVVHTLEGGHALGGSIAPLEPLAKRGVATITVTHFFSKNIASAANSYPFFPDAGSRWPPIGLTEFGREVIAEMERLGIIVDITHATATAVSDILKHSRRPLLASHSSARSLGDHPYSLYDEHIQQIVANGGIIGVILDPYLLSNYATAHDATEAGSVRDVVRTIRYLLKLTGNHKAVAIGSDFAGYIVAPKEMNRLSQIACLSSMLMADLGDPDIVEDIMANNAIDFLMSHWRSGL